MDAEAAMMIKEIFQKFEHRPNATQCLQMKFITNHSLPIMLPANTMVHIETDRKMSSESIIITRKCLKSNELINIYLDNLM